MSSFKSLAVRKELRPLDHQHPLASHANEPPRKDCLQPQSSLQMTVVQPPYGLQPHERIQARFPS